MNLKQLFVKTATVNTATAACNLLGTVLLVRWFGADVYANFLVDLAYLSLLSILLEVVPSNYSLFRVQDDPTKIGGIAALAIVTAFVLIGAAQVSGYALHLFNANSVWIAPYAGSLAVKRYLDIRLQSTGRLREYFGIGLLGATIRVALMGWFLWWDVQPVTAVWASLTCATLLAQISWFAKNPDERRVFRAIVDQSAWIPLIQERRAYVPYYLGISFKRLRDNLTPILASIFFVNRETLGAFFLAYRGLLYTLGQLRVIEGLLNHRDTLATVNKLSFYHRSLVAIVGQFVSIVASLCLMFASGIESFQFLTVIILSFTVWFYIFSMLERAKAFSNYDTLSVNSSMVSYCIFEAGLVWLFMTLGIRSESVFSIILVCAEGTALWTMYLSAKYWRDRKLTS